VFAVERMSRWRRGATGGMLAAVALVLLDPQVAHAAPGVPVSPSGLSSQPADGVLSEADRDFVSRVRLAGLFPLGDGGLSEADRDFVIRVRLAGLRG